MYVLKQSVLFFIHSLKVEYLILEKKRKRRKFFFQNSLNLRISAIFEIFKKNKCKLMCYTYSNTLIFEVFDDNLAVTDEKWQVCFGEFCLSWCLFSFHCPYRHGVCDLKFLIWRGLPELSPRKFGPACLAVHHGRMGYKKIRPFPLIFLPYPII